MSLCAGYFENLKVLAQKEGIDHNSNAFKVLFFRNLSPDNKKEVIRFGMEKPINEIVDTWIVFQIRSMNLNQLLSK